MSRVLREHARDAIALLLLIVAGVAVTLVILVNQGAPFPAWVPGLGQKTFQLKAEFSTAQAVTPGQGQSVDIAGVRVGEVTDVETQQGTSVVTVDIEPEYASLIHRNASILLRPKTGLNDMVLALDPGTEGSPSVDEGYTLPLSQTEPNVQPDEVLSALDGDTRDYLKLLVAGGAEGFGGRAGGERLGNVMRRFAPVVKNLGLINSGLARRRDSIASGIHNFSLVSDELAANNQSLADFVVYSDQALAGFAAQESALRKALRELPSTLSATNSALVLSNQLALNSKPALTRNLPGARALDNALYALQPFFAQTTPPIQNQITPFTVATRDPSEQLSKSVIGLGNATPGLKSGLTDFNGLLNALAYNPTPSSSRQSYLFWLQWLNRNANASVSLQDANGPLGRGQVLLDCNTRTLADGASSSDPLFNVLLQIAGLPQASQICPVP